MSSVQLQCQVCTYGFDDCNRKPLILDCGHTLCWTCLDSVLGSQSVSCPFCQEVIKNTNLDSHRVNYMLIPSPGDGICNNHGHEMDIWCNTCCAKFCIKCLRHHHNHSMLYLEDLSSDTNERKYVLAKLKSMINAYEISVANTNSGLKSAETLVSKFTDAHQTLEPKLKFLRDAATHLESKTNTSETRVVYSTLLKELSKPDMQVDLQPFALSLGDMQQSVIKLQVRLGLLDLYFN